MGEPGASDAGLDVQHDQPLDRFTFLAESAAELLAADGSADFLERIYPRIARMLAIDLCLHYAVTTAGDRLQLVSCRGISPSLQQNLQRLDFGQDVCGAVALTGRPVIVHDVQATADESVSRIRSLGITRCACFPLIARCGLIGAVAFGARQGIGFDNGVLVLLRCVCDQVATALDRERAEHSLRQSEQWFRLLLEKSTDAILVADDDGRFLLVNDAACQLLGYPRQQLLEMRVGDLRAVGTHETIVLFQQYLAKGEEAGTFDFMRSDGQHRIADYTAVNFAPGQHLAILRDVTERRRVEQALQESEERLRTLLETAADAIITIDRDNAIHSLNPAAQRMLGYSAEEAVGHHLRLLMPSPYFEEHEAALARCANAEAGTADGLRREVVAQRKDGTTFPADLAVSPMPTLGMCTWILRDISEHKQLEAEVIRIAEEEQRRIGEALHDDIQQEIAAVGLMVHAAVDRLNSVQPPDDPRQSDALASAKTTGLRAAKIASETLRHVQALSRSMVPREIDAHGLQAALAEMARQMNEMTSAACCFHGDAETAVQNNDVATHLYRIAQEAVTNAIKHAHADRIDIFLQQQHDRLELRVRDHGIGIAGDPELELGPGMGLRLMRHRASLIGATISVAAALGGGTEMLCQLPMADAPHPPNAGAGGI